ncbi:SDR family NAD(P)-dependent oxidoreductase [Streptomyces kebangsaanensis]|uniref:SDR family NAD(P)-dependent oxidoreductase n=1 Tax=Streptomyces kebangsaanensis TaxID=864058 RepID=UPI00093D2CF3|nr:SDR family NAD(P)-dependent oxidoreductase [Streptomyces kebangsaanensis]
MAAVFGTNRSGTFWSFKRAMQSMLWTKHGRVVPISSAVALTSEARQTSYGASKAGASGFGKSLAKEIDSRGTTVNIVTPSLTDTGALVIVGVPAHAIAVGQRDKKPLSKRSCSLRNGRACGSCSRSDDHGLAGA